MKKLLVALIAISSVSALAHHHDMKGHKHEGKDLKHMVRFFDFGTDGVSGSFDVAFNTKEQKNSDSAGNNIALNYAYAINNTWQIGGTYKNKHTGGAGDTNEIGVSAYYNTGKSIDSTCYYGLHYSLGTDKTAADDKKTTTITLEYGHRFHVGHVWGLHLTYSPSLMVSQSTLKDDAANTEDITNTALAWNWVKFDLLF